MEQDSQDVKLFKDGELVATADYVRLIQVPMPASKGADANAALVTHTCFHLPKISLERMFIFRVLNRQPLSALFNGCGIEIDGARDEPLYYVHGLVETFRGNPSISAVVLTKPNVPLSKQELASSLPDLYRRFSVML